MTTAFPITLVVPVRDEAATLEPLCRSIEAQTRPPDAVVLVDAGSTDATLLLARRACAGRPHWQVIDAGPATPGRARNVGIAAAGTAWVALTDAGIELDRNWLDRLARFAVADPTVDVVYGSYRPAPSSWFTRCAALAYVAPMTAGPRGPVRDHSIASSLVRTEVWRQAGGFPDLRAAEDRIFMRRLGEIGARQVSSPEAMVQWSLPPTVASTFRRFRTYSRVNALAGQQHHWHHGVRRMYVVAAACLLLARFDRRWVAVPAVGAVVRAGRGIWVRREGRPVRWALNPGRLATTMGILVVLDAATFTGWVEASLTRRRP